MGKPLFTPEEPAELAAFDAEIDESNITADDIKESRKRDRQAVLGEMDNQKRKCADRHRAYREANREKIAENKRAYYEANREKIAKKNRAYYEANREKIAENKRAYYEANREKWNAYQREYRKRRRTHGENQSSKHHHQGAAGCVRGADAPGEDDAPADR